MPISEYIKGLREHVGHRPLLTPGADALVHDAEGRLLLTRRRDDGLFRGDNSIRSSRPLTVSSAKSTKRQGFSSGR